MSQGVTVDFNANLARFTGAIDKATSDLNRFQSNADRISNNIGRAFAGLGVGLSVGAFTAFIKSSVDAQDHLNDLAKTTRLTVEQLAGLASASKKSGSDLDATAKAINKLAVEMGKDAEKFKLLGITAKDPLEAFGQLADVFKSIDDPQKRAAVGAAALGKSWAEAAPLMEEGSKAIQEMIKQGTELSKVTTESAKAADEFNDKWEDLKTIAGGWGVAIANPIVAGLLKIHDALSLEIKKGPGSIAEFIFGPTRQMGWTGAKDANGLPVIGAPASAAAAPGKPTAKALDAFLGGGGKGGKSRLDQLLDEQRKRIAELNSLVGDEQMVSVDSIARQYEKAIEDRAAAMDELHMKRMEMYRIETEGEEAVREHLEKSTAAMNEMSQFAIEAARNMQDAMADGFFDLMQGKFDNMGESFKRTIDRMVANAVAADLARRMFGDFGKTGEVGGWAKDLLGGLSGLFGKGGGVSAEGAAGLAAFGFPGYADGTPYVPRTGLALIHQGERIVPAAQNRAGFGGNITVIVQGGSAPDVRRAAGQGAREAMAAFSGARRYA